MSTKPSSEEAPEAGPGSWWPAIPRWVTWSCVPTCCAAQSSSGSGAGLRIVGSKYSPDTRRVRDFAVGDVRVGSAKRVATAVGEGAMAIRLAFERTGPA